MLRAPLPATELASRPGALDRRHSGAGAAHGDQHFAHQWALPGAAVRQLPPRAQPRRLERAGGSAGAARSAAGDLRAGRAGAAGPRRHHRAPARQAHQRQRDLSGPGPLQPRSLREGQRPALAQPDAAGADLLGRAGLGTAVPDGPCPVGAETAASMVGSTRNSPTGGGSWSCRPAAGCRGGRSCW